MSTASILRLPQLSGRFVPVWRRNLLVWRKLAIASVLGNIADPMLYMLAIGYGIVTVDTMEQAKARAFTDRGDKGGDAAHACLAMVALGRRWRNA